jgi:hypothetical protein
VTHKENDHQGGNKYGHRRVYGKSQEYVRWPSFNAPSNVLTIMLARALRASPFRLHKGDFGSAATNLELCAAFFARTQRR